MSHSEEYYDSDESLKLVIDLSLDNKKNLSSDKQGAILSSHDYGVMNFDRIDCIAEKRSSRICQGSRQFLKYSNAITLAEGTDLYLINNKKNRFQESKHIFTRNRDHRAISGKLIKERAPEKLAAPNRIRNWFLQCQLFSKIAAPKTLKSESAKNSFLPGFVSADHELKRHRSLSKSKTSPLNGRFSRNDNISNNKKIQNGNEMQMRSRKYVKQNYYKNIRNEETLCYNLTQDSNVISTGKTDEDDIISIEQDAPFQHKKSNEKLGNKSSPINHKIWPNTRFRKHAVDRISRTMKNQGKLCLKKIHSDRSRTLLVKSNTYFVNKSRTVIVENVNISTIRGEIILYFSRFGSLTRVYHQPGLCAVVFSRPNAASTAVMLERHFISGCEVKVLGPYPDNLLRHKIDELRYNN